MASLPLTASYPSRLRPANITAWILQGLLAAAFLAAAGAKLSGAPMMVDVFRQIGLGQGFRYVTGTVEVIGVVALLAPRLSALGGLWLAATMTGATAAHLLRLHTSPAPALVLLILSLAVAWLRRDQLAALADRLR